MTTDKLTTRERKSFDHTNGVKSVPAFAPDAARCELVAPRSIDVERPPGAPTTGEPESWVIRVRQTYAFTGYDPGQRDYTVSYVLKRTTQGWRSLISSARRAADTAAS